MQQNLVLSEQYIKTKRHQEAAQYALEQIKQSKVFPYVKALILYGSCAKKQEQWNSDVDLFLLLDPDMRNQEEMHRNLRLLRSDVTTDDISMPEVDLHVAYLDDWNMQVKNRFYQNIREDGITLWN